MKKVKHLALNVVIVIIIALSIIIFAFGIKNLINLHNVKSQRQTQLALLLENRNVQDYIHDFIDANT